ncbi:MAG: hypothetical protein ABIJ09_02400, partial [Pseudomonadota bacterium]
PGTCLACRCEAALHDQFTQIHQWQSVTGFDDPDSLGLYLSRQTVRQGVEMRGGMLRKALRERDEACNHANALARALEDELDQCDCRKSHICDVCARAIDVLLPWRRWSRAKLVAAKRGGR